MVDFFSESMDDLARCPVPRGVCVFAFFLLYEHGVENGHHPVFEQAVVAIGHNEITYPIHTLSAERCAGRGERAEVGRGEALDEVFFDTTGCGDDCGDVVVLGEIAEGFTQAGRD